MKTRTASWDYNRNVGVAEYYTEVCPNCGAPARPYACPDNELRWDCSECGEFGVKAGNTELEQEQVMSILRLQEAVERENNEPTSAAVQQLEIFLRGYEAQRDLERRMNAFAWGKHTIQSEELSESIKSDDLDRAHEAHLTRYGY